MGGPTVSQEVKDFIASHITSVVELEALLLLQAEPASHWSAEELAQKLKVDSAWLDSQLGYLCSRGLLRCHQDQGTTYSYGPKTPEIDRAIKNLAQVYSNLRVQIISLIYSKPIDKIQVFADAFRIRKERTDG